MGNACTGHAQVNSLLPVDTRDQHEILSAAQRNCPNSAPATSHLDSQMYSFPARHTCVTHLLWPMCQLIVVYGTVIGLRSSVIWVTFTGQLLCAMFCSIIGHLAHKALQVCFALSTAESLHSSQ